MATGIFRSLDAMTPLSRGDLDPDPLTQFRRWFAEAETAVPAAEKMALATVSADGRRSLSCSQAVVRAWDLETGTALGTYDWEIRLVRSVAVSPDGLLAAAGGHRHFVVWDLD